MFEIHTGYRSNRVLDRNFAYMFEARRDLYKALGYSRNISVQQLRYRYERGGMAKALVDIRPETTWSGRNRLTVDGNPNEELDLTARNLRLWRIMQRADLFAEIVGYSGIIILGGPLSSPPSYVGGLAVWGADRLKINRIDDDGTPMLYDLRLPNGRSEIVHGDRVIHIADGYLDSNLIGLPRLVPIWNRLDDLDKVLGAGAEGFWRGAFPGLHFNYEGEGDLNEEQLVKLRDQADAYEHDARRSLRTSDVSVTQLQTDVVDFSPQTEALVGQVAAACRVPQRVLMGSERAHLASTQDRIEWYERINERRYEYVEYDIVARTVARIVEIELGQAVEAWRIGVAWSAWPDIISDVGRMQDAEQQTGRFTPRDPAALEGIRGNDNGDGRRSLPGVDDRRLAPAGQPTA